MSRTIQGTVHAFKNGETTPTVLLEETLARIKEKEHLNAFVEVFEGTAREEAKRADRMIKEGTATALTGVPYALKDNFCVKGRSTTACSKILNGYVSPYTATVVKRLQKQSAVCVGRTNMDEFAMGSSTETSCYGPTKHPEDPTRVPGGSSGGSAVAVAAGIVPFALASDTGGSVRQPAGFCGCVGFKPTYATVSRHGLLTLASSLDVVGVCGNTVDCARMVFDCIKGEDGYDATVSVHTAVSAADPDPAREKCMEYPHSRRKRPMLSVHSLKRHSRI